MKQKMFALIRASIRYATQPTLLFKKFGITNFEVSKSES